MNKYIDTEIILNRKIEPYVYVYIMIIIVISLSLIMLLVIYHYKTYYKVKGIITKEEDNYYIRIYIPLEDIKYLTNNNYIIIDNKNYTYNIISLDKEYYQNELNTYQVIKIELNIPDNYKYDNLTLDLKLLKEDKRVIDYIVRR